MAAYADHTSKHVLLWYVHRNTRSPAARVLVLSYTLTFHLHCTDTYSEIDVVLYSWTYWTRLNMHYIYSELHPVPTARRPLIRLSGVCGLSS